MFAVPDCKSDFPSSHLPLFPLTYSCTYVGARRSRWSIRGSLRYVGVHKLKVDDVTEEKGKGEKEDELKSRPLPIPTESDIEEEEEEEAAAARARNDPHFSVNTSSRLPPIDPGYSTISSDMRESIIQSAHRTSIDQLKEQGYEMVHSTSAEYKSPRSLSPQPPNVYNIPRGSSPVGEYELPVSSQSQSPAVAQMKHAVRAQSAPHPLTYDVPPSRSAPVEVAGGQFGIPSARNHLYSNTSDMYDVPRNSQLTLDAGSSAHLPATYDVPPPRSSLNANVTYDIPRSATSGSIPTQHQNGFVDSTYDKPSSIPANTGTPRLTPRIQEPDSTYDMPSSRPAKNENNYDVLPPSPQVNPNSDHSPSSAEDPPKVLTTPKRSRRVIPSPAASPDVNSVQFMFKGFSSLPRLPKGNERHYDVLAKRPVVVENDQPVQNVEGYYDTPTHRPTVVAPVPLEEDNVALQNGKSDEVESISADASTGDAPSVESSPSSKREHPYSKVKRLVSSDGKQQKVTVTEEWEGDSQELQPSGTTSFIMSGPSHASMKGIARVRST